MAVARCTARRYRGMADADDLESAAMLSLMYAASTYDPNHPRGATFITYLIFVTRRRCWKAVADARRVRENERHAEMDWKPCSHRDLAQVDDRDEIEHAIANEPNPVTAEVIRYLYNGATRPDLPAVFGVTKARIHQRIESFRNNRLGVAV